MKNQQRGPWKENLGRLSQVMDGISDRFGRRLGSIMFDRSVYEAPLDVFRVVLDGTSADDLKALERLALGDCITAIHSKFGVRVRILPTLVADAGKNPAGKPSKGPHDRGPPTRKRRDEAVSSLDTGHLRSFSAHDNVYGRTVTILDREGGDFLMKSAGEGRLIVRYRLLKQEIVQLFDKGWLC